MDILGEICEHIDRLIAYPRAGPLPGPHAVPLIWASTAQLVAQAAALPDCPAYHAQFTVVERATATPTDAWLALFRRQVETIAPIAAAR